jgi:hypothetical protein
MIFINSEQASAQKDNASHEHKSIREMVVGDTADEQSH